MSSKIIEVADAIVAAINAGSFSQRLTARRRYVPRVDLKDAGTVFATVVPKAIRAEQATRTHVFKEIDVDVAIQKRLPATANPEDDTAIVECDALMLLADEVLDSFVAGTEYAGCPLLRVPDSVIPYHPEHLQNDKTFTAVMTLTVKQL